MAGKGKKKRTAADEAENRLEPGLEQLLEEVKKEKNVDGKDKRYHRRVKLENDMREKYCEQPEELPKFKAFVEDYRKRIEAISKFKLEEYRTKCGEPNIDKMLKAKHKKRIKKSSENDGTDKLPDEDTFHNLCDFEMLMGYLAEIGTPSEPPNAAAGSSGFPHYEELEPEVYKAFCEMPGISDMFKAFSEEYIRKRNEDDFDLEEDDIADRENKAAEADDVEWALLPLPDFGILEWPQFSP